MVLQDTAKFARNITVYSDGSKSLAEELRAAVAAGGINAEVDDRRIESLSKGPVGVFGSSLDATIITTALPAITQDIGGQAQYVWIANSWAVAATAVQPLAGQLSNIFGRRFTMIGVVLLFVLGSGIAGGPVNVAMLIVGRTVQGLGSGGIVMITDLVVCDMIPMRERGKYLGLIGATATISTMLGPIIGGALAVANWRCVFYIQVPIGGIAALVMFFFLRLNHRRESTWTKAFTRIDYIGNILFIASIVSILLGLIMGGTVFPWPSFRVIVPIVLGFADWAVFHMHQASGLSKEPIIPSRLFTNRTSAAAFVLSFISAMLLEWIVYFLPIYFQGVERTTPLISGVDMLPFNAFFFPFAIVAGGLLSKTGRYRPIHAVGFAAVALGSGLFVVLDSGSNKAQWVFFQIFAAVLHLKETALKPRT
ncbi:MAG: hypothetical protein LQ340_002859 [Diploschistes diacapsis]|nr:MAG: hypothetical protein LQ340_002859 [Diploschistes diacapsis]